MISVHQLRYGLSENLPNQFITLGIISIFYVISDKEYKKHFTALVAVPALIGSLTPPLFYVFMYLVLHTKNYALSHSPAIAIFVIPVSHAVVFALQKFSREQLPKYWYVVVGLITAGSLLMQPVINALGY